MEAIPPKRAPNVQKEQVASPAYGTEKQGVRVFANGKMENVFSPVT